MSTQLPPKTLAHIWVQFPSYPLPSGKKGVTMKPDTLRLLAELEDYINEFSNKMDALEGWGQGPLEHLGELLRDVSEELVQLV